MFGRTTKPDDNFEDLLVPYFRGKVGRFVYDFSWMKCPGIRLKRQWRDDYKGISLRIFGYQLIVGIPSAN